jgi:hypothetical protein
LQLVQFFALIRYSDRQYQADLDVCRAGNKSRNPHLKKASQDVEQAMLTLATT